MVMVRSANQPLIAERSTTLRQFCPASIPRGWVDQGRRIRPSHDDILAETKLPQSEGGKSTGGKSTGDTQSIDDGRAGFDLFLNWGLEFAEIGGG